MKERNYKWIRTVFDDEVTHDTLTGKSNKSGNVGCVFVLTGNDEMCLTPTIR